MTLAAVVLASMLAMSPTDAADLDRKTEIAAAIADVAAEAPLWPEDDSDDEATANGLPPANEAATGLLLAAIARHESGFGEDVRRCRRRGDHGRSIGMFQLMRPWSWDGHAAEEICSDDRLQARLALRVLRTQRDRCPTCDVRAWLRAYASGSMGVDSPAAHRLAAIYALALHRAGVDASIYSPRAPRWN